ncbi:vitamin D3 receptor B-like isoform X2 [Macrobrachium rosenbergii]|uniref:vitamin D3 receptor B-like isoform X2 n=1 Tax=Macrobrachium rosenbergii TaxID=79674 RepID=UPI0034D4156D
MMARGSDERRCSMEAGGDQPLIDLTSLGWETTTQVKREKTEEMDEEMELDVEVKGVIKHEIREPAQDASLSCQVSSSASQDNDSDADESKRCGVCDRVARCNHFGAICCDSCKAFFRRSVQSRVFDTFFCLKEGKCDVNQNRKSCQACRFKRCQDIGMDTSLVMNEQERKALMSRKLERRRKMAIEHKRRGAQRYHNGRSDLLRHGLNPLGNLQPHRSPSYKDHGNDVHHALEFLSVEDQEKISGLRKLLLRALSFPEFPQHYYEKNADVLEHLFFVFCKSMGKFLGSAPELRELQINDQRILLKPAVARAAFIFGTHQYDSEREWWPRRQFTHSCTFPRIMLSSVEKFVDDDTTMCKWRFFFQKYYYLYSDEIFMILSLMVALFDHDDSNLVGTLEIASRKRKYIHLLERYMQQYQARIPITNAMSHFLESLVDLQELGECFQKPSAEENLGSTARQKESLKFSSSLGDGVNLPLKKALNKRTASFSKESENDEVIILDDDDDDDADLNSLSETKPCIQKQILNYPVKQEYGYPEIQQSSSNHGVSSSGLIADDKIYEPVFMWPDQVSSSQKPLIPQFIPQNRLSEPQSDQNCSKQKADLFQEEVQSRSENDGDDHLSDQVTFQPLPRGTLDGDLKSNQSSEEELFKVLYKSLPPNLAELWAKKICSATKEHV